MNSGRVTLTDYVMGTWAPAYGSQLARKTQLHYEQLLVKHVLPDQLLHAVETEIDLPDSGVGLGFADHSVTAAAARQR